jgi:hypothetical protein
MRRFCRVLGLSTGCNADQFGALRALTVRSLSAHRYDTQPTTEAGAEAPVAREGDALDTPDSAHSEGGVAVADAGDDKDAGQRTPATTTPARTTRARTDMGRRRRSVVILPAEAMIVY